MLFCQTCGRVTALPSVCVRVPHSTTVHVVILPQTKFDGRYNGVTLLGVSWKLVGTLTKVKLINCFHISFAIRPKLHRCNWHVHICKTLCLYIVIKTQQSYMPLKFVSQQGVYYILWQSPGLCWDQGLVAHCLSLQCALDVDACQWYVWFWSHICMCYDSSKFVLLCWNFVLFEWNKTYF